MTPPDSLCPEPPPGGPGDSGAALTREGMICWGMRFVAGYLSAHDFIISDAVMRALGPFPEGIDPRTVARETFMRLRKAGLIRKAGLTESPRRDGGYTGLWTPEDRNALARWLRTNPPDPATPPALYQTSFAFIY